MLDGSSCVFVAIDGRVAGALLIDDPIRPDTPRVIRALRRVGIKRVVMVTGDAVVYYAAQSTSALVIYERGHVSAGEIFRFGLWMTFVAWVAIALVALPWWAAVGQPLVAR